MVQSPIRGNLLLPPQEQPERLVTRVTSGAPRRHRSDGWKRVSMTIGNWRKGRCHEAGDDSSRAPNKSMRSRYPSLAMVAAVSVALALSPSLADSWTQSQAAPQPQNLIHSVSGSDLFYAYCASCHGSNGEGHGPAAEAMKTKVPDLTLLSKHRAGQFPEEYVRKTILGDESIAAHGSREMPIWGPVFHQIEEDVDRGNVRLENLVRYLESIQEISASGTTAKSTAKTASDVVRTPSGLQLYNQHCAACHGKDLKGNGPAPPPFDHTPDLTTLSKRHGGQFPDAYVTNALQNGVEISAHGPAEMPIWGTTFKESEKLDHAQITARIANLVGYLKSHQDK